jgi:phage shock protein C
MESRQERRLHRSQSDKMIAGVCGGLADFFDIDPVIFRVSFVLLAFFGGSGLLIYIVLALLMPPEGKESAAAGSVLHENANDLAESARQFGNDLGGQSSMYSTPEAQARRAHNRQVGGLILVGLGLLFLLNNLNLFWWLNWDRLWPAILIVLGVAILIGQSRRR